MSDSTAKRWVVLYVLFGVALAPAQTQSADLSQKFQPIEQDNNEQSSAATRQRSPKQQTGPKPNAAIVDLFSEIASSLEAPESQEQAERSRQDLEAQKSMAFYAWMMAVVAGIQAILTFFGILLVWRTLITTKDATSAAAKAAEAADKSVTVTQAIGEKQVRAYLGKKSSTAVNILINQKPQIHIDIMNSGMSPALDVKVRQHAVCCFSDDIPKMSFKASREKSVAVVPPNIPISAINNLDVSLDSNLMEMLSKGDVCIIVAGYVSYTDVFKRRHRTIYKMRMDRGVTDKGMGSFNTCEKGNRAT